jgi:hypothetical protein
VTIRAVKPDQNPPGAAAPVTTADRASPYITGEIPHIDGAQIAGH